MKPTKLTIAFQRLGISIALSCAILLLTSCGNAGTDNDGGGSSETFSATVSGDATASVNGTGYFMCETVNSGEFNIAASSSLTDNVLISLPNEIAAGTHALESEDTNDSTISATYVGASASSDTYGQNVTGSLTLTAVPSGPGDRVAGSFSFQAERPSAGPPPTVMVTGDFDFTAGSSSFFVCSP